MTGVVCLPAPAKINLALHVTGRRDDGYHLIDTLAVFARFGDDVCVEPAGEDGFIVGGPYAAMVPLDGGNLVLRARDLLRQTRPELAHPVLIRLEKRMPPASGIGGGSSDAAATLKALAALWRLPADAQALARLALPLGADLPMCVMARPLLARGIGEAIEPARGLPALALVLANPGQPVATRDVFARLSRRDGAALPPPPAGGDAVTLARYLRGCRNDLQEAAVAAAPAIAEVLAALEAQDPLLARMSGSGATCFGLFADTGRAAAAAAAIGRARPGWFVTATATGGSDDARD